MVNDDTELDLYVYFCIYDVQFGHEESLNVAWACSWSPFLRAIFPTRSVPLGWDGLRSLCMKEVYDQGRASGCDEWYVVQVVQIEPSCETCPRAMSVMCYL